MLKEILAITIRIKFSWLVFHWLECVLKFKRILRALTKLVIPLGIYLIFNTWTSILFNVLHPKPVIVLTMFILWYAILHQYIVYSHKTLCTVNIFRVIWIVSHHVSPLMFIIKWKWGHFFYFTVFADLPFGTIIWIFVVSIHWRSGAHWRDFNQIFLLVLKGK